MRVPRYLLLVPIYIYRQLISPAIPPHCIYHPSCSAYAYTSIEKHGLLKGGVLAVARVVRCSALFTGGNDPVPELFSFEEVRDGYRRFRRRKADGVGE